MPDSSHPGALFLSYARERVSRGVTGGGPSEFLRPLGPDVLDTQATAPRVRPPSTQLRLL